MSCNCGAQKEFKKVLDHAANVPGRNSNVTDPYFTDMHQRRPDYLYYHGGKYSTTVNDPTPPKRDVREVRKENVTKRMKFDDYVNQQYLPFRSPDHYLYSDVNN